MHAPESHLDDGVVEVTERHVHGGDADSLRKNFAGEVRRRADAERRVVELAGTRAREDRKAFRILEIIGNPVGEAVGLAAKVFQFGNVEI